MRLGLRCATWFLVAGVPALPGVARADVFDDARRTVTRDIPHFFQDEIPCTFGGHPTSGARTACRPARPAAPPASGPASGPARPARAPEPPARRP